MTKGFLEMEIFNHMENIYYFQNHRNLSSWTKGAHPILALKPALIRLIVFAICLFVCFCLCVCLSHVLVQAQHTNGEMR